MKVWHLRNSSVIMVDINGVEKTLLELHKVQLQSSGVPSHLWPALFRKLLGQVGLKLCTCMIHLGDSSITFLFLSISVALS